MPGPDFSKAKVVSTPAPDFENAKVVSAPSIAARSMGAVGGAFGNDYLAFAQGANPTVQSMFGRQNYERLGDYAQFDHGPGFLGPDGQPQDINPKKHVVFIDPDTQAPAVYLRNKDMEESLFTRIGRLLNIGTLAQPVTRLPGGTAEVSPLINRAMNSNRLGIDETLATLTQSPTLGKLENWLSEVPVIGGFVNGRTGRAVQQTERALQNTASGFGGGATPQDAAAALRSGAEAYKSAFQRRAGIKYDLVDKFMPPDAAVEMTKTATFMNGIIDKFKKTPNIAGSVLPPKFRGYLEDIVTNNGVLDYGALKDFRTFVGRQAFEGGAPIEGITTGQWKDLYKNLTEDIEAGFKAAKDPRALEAFRRANKHYEDGVNRINGALSFIFKSEEGATKIYDDFLALARDRGARANVSKLEQVRKALPNEEWDTVVATTVRNLGTNRAGEFSPAAFLTAYGGMNDEAKKILFGGKPSLMRDLDDLKDVVTRRTNVDRWSNTSGTANPIIASGSVWAAVTQPLKFASSFAGGVAMSELMTNPKVVAALAGASKAARQGDKPAAIMNMNALKYAAPKNSELYPLLNAMAEKYADTWAEPDQQQ